MATTYDLQRRAADEATGALYEATGIRARIVHEDIVSECTRRKRPYVVEVFGKRFEFEQFADAIRALEVLAAAPGLSVCKKIKPDGDGEDNDAYEAPTAREASCKTEPPLTEREQVILDLCDAYFALDQPSWHISTDTLRTILEPRNVPKEDHDRVERAVTEWRKGGRDRRPWHVDPLHAAMRDLPRSRDRKTS